MRIILARYGDISFRMIPVFYHLQSVPFIHSHTDLTESSHEPSIWMDASREVTETQALQRNQMKYPIYLENACSLLSIYGILLG
jgi:hypothetical protein